MSPHKVPSRSEPQARDHKDSGDKRSTLERCLRSVPGLLVALLVLSSAVVHAGQIAGTPIDRKAAMLDIMVGGSLQVSRTKSSPADINRWILPLNLEYTQIPVLAERNFIATARYVLDNAADLDVHRNPKRVASVINAMLTEDMVNEREGFLKLTKARGNPNYYGRNPKGLWKWLSSKEARKLAESDPVALAEAVHHQLSLADAFPDGNGRTARMMADLILIRAGRAPVKYTKMEDYFRRASPRGDRLSKRYQAPGRDAQIAYFREAAAEGDRLLRQRGFDSTGPKLALARAQSVHKPPGTRTGRGGKGARRGRRAARSRNQ